MAVRELNNVERDHYYRHDDLFAVHLSLVTPYKRLIRSPNGSAKPMNGRVPPSCAAEDLHLSIKTSKQVDKDSIMDG